MTSPSRVEDFSRAAGDINEVVAAGTRRPLMRTAHFVRSFAGMHTVPTTNP
jgi:hypothetical protein